MKEQIVTLIEQLAQKLGTTTEYLWNVLIAQANVQIYIFITVFVSTIIGIIVAVYLLKYTQKYWDKEDAPMTAWLALGFGTVVGFIALIGIVFTIANISDVITAIRNPEYWALKEVLNVLK